MMRNTVKCAVLGMLLLLVLTSAGMAQKAKWVEKEKQRVKKTTIIEEIVEKDTRSTVDWEDRYVEVVAEGTAVDCPDAAVCRIQAEEVARTRAYKILASTVEGLSITAETQVMDEVKLKSITITRLEAFIKGSRVMETEYKTVGGKTVAVITLGFLMDNPDGFSKMVIPAVKERIEKKPPKIYEPTPELRARAIVEEKVTGLIVDARGLGLKPAMSPQVVTKSGGSVYGIMDVDADYAIKEGIVIYARSIEGAKAREDRAGKNPMVVKATGVDGKLKANAVISDEDAAKILNANRATNFLENCAVVFVID